MYSREGETTRANLYAPNEMAAWLVYMDGPKSNGVFATEFSRKKRGGGGLEKGKRLMGKIGGLVERESWRGELKSCQFRCIIASFV